MTNTEYSIGDRVSYKLSDSINYRTGTIIKMTDESYDVLNDKTDYSDRIPKDWKSLSKIVEESINTDFVPNEKCPF